MRTAEIDGYMVIGPFSEGEVGVHKLAADGKMLPGNFPFWKGPSFEYVCEHLHELLAEREPIAWGAS